MADGQYCDYSAQMESAMLQHLANYGPRSAGESLGSGADNQGKSTTGGFYMDQFATNMPCNVMETVNSMMIAGVTGNHGNQEGLDSGGGGGGVAGHPVPVSLYEHVMNYAMKPEKGLPLTPPGSPDESKETHPQNMHHSFSGNSHMHPASMVPMATSLHHHLAKPVPMRRLSEKRIAQARACLSTSSSTSTSADGLGDHHRLGPDTGGGNASVSTPALARAIAAVQQTQKRPRSEKKAIPDEQKDGKYFERRKRNNNAAKKSRDARKSREDEIAIRASFLEKENAILRAQVATLREEANSLRQMLLQKRSRQ